MKMYDVTVFDGLACAAVGNTTYKISIEGGGGGSWTVKQGYYMRYRYVAPYCCNDPDISAKTNSSTAMALHTHCGLMQN